LVSKDRGGYEVKMGPDEHTAPYGHCPNCGTPYGAEDRFCGSCGATRLAQPVTVSHAASASARPRLPSVETPWLIGGAVAVALAVGVGVVLLTSGSGGASRSTLPPNAAAPLAASTGTDPETNTSEANVSETSTGTYEGSSESAESPANAQQEAESSSTTTQESQSSSSPVGALDSYWADIQAHHFSEAYGYLASGSAGLSEAQFVAGEREAKIESVQFNGSTTSDSGSSATVAVASLVTHDAKYGCRRWSGSYTMTEGGEGWRIERAALTPRACSG
jgi:hypothetical protein